MANSRWTTCGCLLTTASGPVSKSPNRRQPIAVVVVVIVEHRPASLPDLLSKVILRGEGVVNCENYRTGKRRKKRRISSRAGLPLTIVFW